jgi:hypothetical protein
MVRALVCAACLFRERGDENTATFLEEYADFLECHVEAWTSTTEGSLVPGIRKHFIRMLPVDVDDINPDENPDRKLLRSIRDQRVFDFIPEVANRYIRRAGCQALEVWKPNRRVRTVQRGWTLRIQAPAPFMLHWSRDEWQAAHDTHASPTALGIYFVDLQTSGQSAPIRFTFYWKHESRWAGRDHEVRVI